jgi:membrane fusion protein, adhesin transport system
MSVDVATGSERLDSLLTKHPMPSWRAFAWPVMIFLIAAMGWAYFASLDEVAVTNGEVVPQGKVKMVQHLEGGIVEALFVTEGDIVKEGAPLLQLDLASSGTNLDELQVRLDSELLVRARLVAEAQGGEIQFDEDVANRRPTLANAQQQAFDARKRELASTLGIMREQVKQKQLETKELAARTKAVKRNYKLAGERLKMSQSLLSEGLTAKIEHLELEAEVESLDGELRSLQPSLPKAQAAVEEATQRLREGEVRFRREAQDELGKVEQNIARVNELMTQANEQGSRAEIKSPIDGVVKNMRYNTIGGVVRPGEPILEIVPTSGNLVIEVKLNPTERGFIRVGQPTVIKISTYDFARYGGLDGEVIRVAPDTSLNEDGSPYFRVVVRTEKNYLGQTEGDLPITPGMQATVDIHTGKKSVMDFLIRPILKLRHEAFRER